MNLATDRSLIPAGTDAVRYLTATLTAPTAVRQNERPAVGVSLVLDRSGSMAGRKLEMARKAAAHALRLLSDRDRLAVVAYDNEVDTLVAHTSASAEAKTLAGRRLGRLDARGSTDLAGGWLRGLEEMATADTADAPEVRRVLLLSDGLANEGETDPGALAKMAAAWRAKGVATSTFGLGADFDEVLMLSLAREGGGNFYYVEQPQQIPDYFASELGEALDVVAQDATFDVVCGPGVQATLLHDFRVEAHAGTGIRVRLGDLVSGQVVSLAFEIRISPRPVRAPALIECRLGDRDGRLARGAGEGATIPPMQVEWKAATAEADRAQPVGRDVLLSVAHVLAARARAEALAENRQGRFAQARQIVRACAAALREMAGGIREIERLADELEAQEEEFNASMPALAMKSLHYEASLQRRSRDDQGKARRAPSVS